MGNIKLKFCGGVEETTGVNYLLTAGKTKILVDCGMFQGPPKAEKKNWEPFCFNPKEIEAVFITHAHLDHIGRLPKLYREGFRGKIYATAPTIDLSRLSLQDAVRLQKGKAKDFGLKPFFDEKDVAGAMNQFAAVDYNELIRVGENIEAELLNAGHILGSAQIKLKIKNETPYQKTSFGTGQELKTTNKNSKFSKTRKQRHSTITTGTTNRTIITIVFTGDLGNWPVPVLHPPEFIDEADYLVVESTYGDRLHEPISERKEKVERAIEYVAASGGALVIPSFALERTQELLFELNELVENRRVPRMPIFLDSPMAERATEIYKKYPNFYNRQAVCIVHCGDDFFKFPGFKMTKTVAESKAINNVKPPKVIIAGSGMMVGGRIQHHLRRYLSDPNSYLLIITYQAKGTLGREIFEIGYKRRKEQRTSVRIMGEEIPVRCKIRAVSAYSSHADQARLREFIEHIRKPEPPERPEGLKQVFVVQGEEEPANALAQLVEDHLGIAALVPKLGEEIDI